MALGGRNSAKKRNLRSKDEIALYEMCRDRWHDTVANGVIAEGWDADIIIPSKKVAILWNGPWHYREMNMNNHSLKQVQTRDRIKMNLFRNLGWRVIVFRDDEDTPESAFKKLVAPEGIEPSPPAYETGALPLS